MKIEINSLKRIILKTKLLVLSFIYFASISTCIIEVHADDSYHLPGARVGENYEYGVVLNGLTEPVSYKWEGEFPDGIKVEGPIIFGIPKGHRDKVYTFKLIAIDALKNKINAYYSLKVNPAFISLRLITESLEAARYSLPYTENLVANGGVPPYTWNLEWEGGSPPSWIKFNKEYGRFSGVPDRIDKYSIIAEVSDAIGNTDRKKLILATKPIWTESKMQIIPEELPIAYIDRLYNAEIVLIGSQGYINWDVKKPDWLSVTYGEKSIKLNGTPKTLGKVNVTVNAMDCDKKQGDFTVFSKLGPKKYDLKVTKVDDTKLDLINLELSCMQGQPVSFPLKVIGGKPPYKLDVIDNLPAGLIFNKKNNSFTGKPKEVGTFMFDVRVTDGSFKTIESSFILHIIPKKISIDWTVIFAVFDVFLILTVILLLKNIKYKKMLANNLNSKEKS